MHALSSVLDHTPESKALLQDFLHGRGIGVILGSTSCKFIRPVTYPDSITVGLHIPPEQLTETATQFVMEHVLLSESQKRVVAVGTGTIVVFDYKNGRRATLPAPLLSAAKKLTFHGQHHA
eukprot:TRINITY_DN680_c0_g1_i4.p1 TRINITY_DN680_c0_g1~~TRINITY_DN680_c0_g1_i4.p1  ORF type:complete len:121 (+),score=20.75 TRINITY_DN680_c0_g1_i4:271-633(+)